MLYATYLYLLYNYLYINADKRSMYLQMYLYSKDKDNICAEMYVVFSYEQLMSSLLKILHYLEIKTRNFSDLLNIL